MIRRCFELVLRISDAGHSVGEICASTIAAMLNVWASFLSALIEEHDGDTSKCVASEKEIYHLN